MLLTFSQEDALKWAAFSGDHNPIHFDAERAKALGMDSMTVHGMRAMHDMKNHLHNMLSSSVSTGEHYRFCVRLRQSVKYHVPHKILASCNTNNGNVSGQLINTLTDEPCFSATLSSVSARPSSKMALMQCISGQEYRALYQQFSSGLNEQNCQWVFEDALLFRCLMQSTDVLSTLANVLPEMKAMTLHEMFEQLPVVQTHHEVHFSDALRHFLAPAAGYSQAFRYDFQPPLVLGDRENGFIIRLGCQGGGDPENLLTTSITLKTWPVVPSTIFE
ncbi:MaoC family dehydratase (plasmid) [Rahnella variigena]|uniref:MaoC family dehydratase n=1 Tax=Rahnella TaxID=34037 RepID=UPI000DD3474D|nr:MaoC/PaaZ C-terminal domain-containing protein [Rahnella sp. AN3-3W3]